MPSSKLDAFMTIMRDAYGLDVARTNLGLALIILSNFFLYFGMFTPLIHFQSMNEDYLISVDHALVVIGVTFFVDIITRVIYGSLSDARCLTPVKLNSVALMFATFGLFSYSVLAHTTGSQVLFTIIFSIGTCEIRNSFLTISIPIIFTCLFLIYIQYLKRESTVYR